MFAYSKTAKNYTQFGLFKGVTDFGNIEQFAVYDSGHSVLVMLQDPTFMNAYGKSNASRLALVNNFYHIIQNEFKGLDGIDDITAETFEINDGLNTLNLINKVKQQSAANITIKLGYEKTGLPIQKYTEAYLTGISDPATGLKHYHGEILDDATGKGIPGGVENEIFTFLYYVTDNTGKNVEKAFMLLAAQLTKSNLSDLNSTRGEHDPKEVSIEFSCFPIRGDAVNELAVKHIAASTVIKQQDKFVFTAKGLDKTATGYVAPTFK